MPKPEEMFLEVLREIEASDGALVEALHARARACRRAARLQTENPASHFPFPRDVDVIGRAREVGEDFPIAGVEAVLREVLAVCHGLVAPITVAFPGPPGAFAHAAARVHFGTSVTLEPLESVERVVDEVQRGRVRYGVLPLETTSDGAVTATLQALLQSDVRVNSELTLSASYALMSTEGSGAAIERIYGAPLALATCERQLKSLRPQAELIDAPSGEIAAELAKDAPAAAVVAPVFLAREHGLHVINDRVEDAPGVEVRFAVVGTDHPPRTGLDRTLLAVAVSDEPGALYRSLKAFAERSINLTRVESRPGRGTPWRYVFFLELDGHITDRVVLTAVEELRSTSPMVKVLGSYARPS